MASRQRNKLQDVTHTGASAINTLTTTNPVLCVQQRSDLNQLSVLSKCWRTAPGLARQPYQVKFAKRWQSDQGEV